MRNEMTIFICLSLVTFGPVDLKAKEIKTPLFLTLSQALEMAQQQNIQVIVARERITQALAGLSEGRSVLFPQLTGSVSEHRQTRDLRSTGISLPGDPLVGPFNSFDARLKITQTIFDLSAVNRLKAARDNHQLSIAEFNKAKQDTLVLVASLFIDAKRAKQNQRLAQIILKRDKKRLEKVLTQKHSGTGTDVEVKEATADYQRSLSQWRLAQSETNKSLLDLKAALGLADADEVVLGGYGNFLTISLTLPKNLEENIEHQPDVRVAFHQYQTQKSQQQAEISGYLPTIAVAGDYGPSGVTPDNSNNTYTLGVSASIPIWEGGLRQAKVKEAASQTKESEAEFQDTRRQTISKIKSAQETWQASLASIKEKNAQLAASSQAFRLAQQRFESGLGSDVERIEALAQQQSADDQLREAVATFLMAKFQLARALGQMDELLKQTE